MSESDGWGKALSSRPPGPAGRAALAALSTDADTVRAAVAALADHAPALLPLAVADAQLLPDVLERPLHRAESERELRRAFLDATAELDDGPELRAVLRRLRHRAIVRLALREVLRVADIDETSAEMAALASAAVDAALRACKRSLEARHGEARAQGGAAVPLVVLGMGKLGGGELNLGSDVDLCFFYETDDAQTPDGALTVHELYARALTHTVQALADVTEDGFCFRVDLRLRPEGTRGPLVNSLASAERYYESWGRTWERAALLRALPIAGDIAFGERLLEALRPFVFRRAVDPGIAREMAEMLARTRRDRGIDDADIKLGRGGIREAEFFVQTLQLVWGGQHRELQVRGTMEALRRLIGAGLVTDREARELGADWALLRRVEHRIHVFAGYQTHALPAPGPARETFAESLGWRDGAALERDVSAARHRVARLFESLAGAQTASSVSSSAALVALCDLVASGASASAVAEHVGAALPVSDPDEAAAHLVGLGRRAGAPLGPVARERSPTLGPKLLREVAETADPDSALRFLAAFFAHVGQWPYERLLLEEPRLMRRLIGLFGASATLSEALVGHPETIDLVLAAQNRPSVEAIRVAHEDPALDEALSDAESFPHVLRRIKREATLRVGLAYAAGELAVSEVEPLLTELAEQQVRAALRHASATVLASIGAARDARAEPAHMVVCAVGKLGGGELGFGGDLDLLFLYDPDGSAHPPLTNAELFTRFAQRTMGVLSQPDPEGRGYFTDARLRPSGSHGLLVVSVAAFDRYHATQARAWERQALVRARPVTCVTDDARLDEDAALVGLVRERMTRLAFLDGAPLAADVAAMRRQMEEELAGETAHRYHSKLGHGGLVDVEFLVQWLEMRHGEDPSVRAASTPNALSALRRAGHIDPHDAEALAEAYELFRRIEQGVKLVDDTREPIVATGRSAERIARQLGLRDRDGHRASDVLVAGYIRHASAVRRIFERVVASVGLPPPWGETRGRSA